MHSTTMVTTERIDLPPGMLPGAIIGVRGQNILRLKRATGASIEVKQQGHVSITGEPRQVAKAKELLQMQIDAFIASGVAGW